MINKKGKQRHLESVFSILDWINNNNNNSNSKRSIYKVYIYVTEIK